MMKYVIILVFMLSVAIAAGSILISSKLRSAFKVECFSTLMYFQTFYFTFGFYTIWGQVILISFLSPMMSGQLMSKTTTIMVLLGAPFMVFTWLMLLKLTRELSGRKIRYGSVFWFLSITTLLAAGIGYLFPKFTSIDSYTIIKYGFIIINLVYTLTGVAWLLFVKRNKPILLRDDLHNIAAGILLTMLLQNGVLLFYKGNIYMALVFIFTFFMGGAFMPVYIRYKSDLSMLLPNSENGITFEELCKAFDVSARERDVIREICNGLSNQQIADKLFISLQTVKDHTSRIYAKTNCNSRAQLITMVKDKT
jgi:DNA-binding CsgD family transcriptional regulator